MKKSLIALAAVAAVGGASAQSSVTLYGVVDIGYGSHKTTGPAGASIKTRGIMETGAAGNRIGFRGVEDLGGGLKAEFVVEQGISPTNDELFGVRTAAAGHQVDGFSAAGGASGVTGSGGAYTTGTNRSAFLGLITGAGTVRIGYQYTNLYELSTLSGYNAGSEAVPGADKAHVFGSAVAGGTRANAITYISPSFGGFTVRAQYGSGSPSRELYESSAPNPASGLTVDKNVRWSLMAKYAAGPLSAAVAHTRNQVTQSARTAVTADAPGAGLNAYGAPVALSSITNTAERTGKMTQLGASYDFGMAKVGLVYMDGENGGSATSTANTEYKATQLSAAFPIGAFAPFVSVGRAEATNQATGVVTEDYNLAQVGVRYSLSKRTTAYVITGRTENDAAGARFTKDQATMVGLVHSF